MCGIRQVKTIQSVTLQHNEEVPLEMVKITTEDIYCDRTIATSEGRFIIIFLYIHFNLDYPIGWYQDYRWC